MFLGNPLRVSSTIQKRDQTRQEFQAALNSYLNHIQQDCSDELIQEVRLMGDMLGKIWTRPLKEA